MDPFTSLSLAAALVQFVDFGSRLVSGTYEIYHSLDGQTAAAAELLQKTTALEELSSNLAGQTPPGSHQDQPGGQVTQLQPGKKTPPETGLAASSADGGDTLTSIGADWDGDDPIGGNNKFGIRQTCRKLDGMTLQLQSASSKTAFNAAPRSSKEHALQQMASNCNAVAEQFQGTLRKMAVNQGKNRKFQSFRQAFKNAWGKKKFVDMEAKLDRYRMELSLQLVAIVSDQQSSVLQDLRVLKDANVHLGSAHSSRLEAIENEFRTMRAEHSPPNKQQESEDHVTGLKKTLERFEFLASSLRSLVNTAKSVATEQIILGSLHFNTMTVRHENVAEAYSDTYKWIFQKHTRSKTYEKVHFIDWLKKKNGVFWVSGKPGSGKSTLMKFLCDHYLTKEALALWAAADECMISKHFFWSAGTPIQKSQEGLLRSLLYDVFRQCPQAAREISGIRWTAAARGDKNPEPWALTELRQTVLKLAEYHTLRYKFCFFIDGLDEYDGDHNDVIRIMTTLATSPNIKLCLSSRPWNIFEDAYGRTLNQKLYLQDLTRNDIRLYVHHRLEEHPNWVAPLDDAEKLQCRQLILDITKKAQGVFLWVFLVIQSLHEGLTNGDSIPVLHRRIRTLPADLEQFFKHMLGTVDPFYHTQMVQSFQVANAASGSLPLMLYAFMDEELDNAGFALKAPIRQMPMYDVHRQHERMKRQLNGRCKGLLEVHSNPFEIGYLQYEVDFLHRTVRDFLRTRDMSVFLDARGHQSQPYTSIFKSFLVLIKSIPLELIDFSEGGSLSRMISHAFYFARQAELEHGEPLEELMEDLGYTLRVYATATGRHIPWYLGCSNTSGDAFGFALCSTFLEFAIQNGLTLYVERQLMAGMRGQPTKQPLLHCALRLWPAIDPDHLDMTVMVQLLLSRGQDPNQISPNNSGTVWSLFLEAYADALATEGSPHTTAASVAIKSSLIQLLLENGANLDARARDGTVAWIRWLRSACEARLSSAAYVPLMETAKLFFLGCTRAGTSLKDQRDETLDDEAPGMMAKSAWKVVCTVVRSLPAYQLGDDKVKLDFVSKLVRLMLLHGADGRQMESSGLSVSFPHRLCMELCDAIEESRGRLDDLDAVGLDDSQSSPPPTLWVWNIWGWFGYGTV